MKVSDNRRCNKMKFGKIRTGTVFECDCNGRYYMRIESTSCQEIVVNAVDLETGALIRFENYEEVIPLFAEIVISTVITKESIRGET